MNKKIIFWAVGMFLILLFAPASNLFSQIEETEDLITITGQVLAAEYDQNDSVIAVVISVSLLSDDSTEDEVVENYWVADNEKGVELFNYIECFVEATGFIEVNDEGENMIYVEDFTVIKND